MSRPERRGIGWNCRGPLVDRIVIACYFRAAGTGNDRGRTRTASGPRPSSSGCIAVFLVVYGDPKLGRFSLGTQKDGLALYPAFFPHRCYLVACITAGT